MKKFFLFLLLVIVCTAGLFWHFNLKRSNLILNRSKKGDWASDKSSPTKMAFSKKAIEKKAIFIPYWTVEQLSSDKNSLSQYDRLIYFGVTANEQGIEMVEAGGLKLDRFIEKTKGKNILLALRLLNDDFNKTLLKNKELQKKIIADVRLVLKEKNFSGLVLDLELFSLFNNDIKNQINDFVKQLYTALKSDYKILGITIYGDVFFRKRPLDLQFLAKNSDEILVMAYDFHKSRGEPGPNFPFETGRQYDYSFKQMISDFKKIVPEEKLTIIFGMYGYDWPVDEKKRPFAQAKALTLKEIKQKFFDNTLSRSYQSDEKGVNCSQTSGLKSCLLVRDPVAKESQISYLITSDTPDDQGVYRIDYHIVWFEDEESVKVKSEYLENERIESVGYWAYGYF